MGDTKRTITVILEAAKRVIVQSGVEKATIEQVAREAGVSKGGVLHHFPSKEAIVLGLVGKLIEEFEADIAALQADDPTRAGSFTRAFLNAGTKKSDHCSEVFLPLQAAFRTSTALQELLHDAHTRWQARIEDDGIDPVRATVVRLVTDGLWLAKVHRVTVPTDRFKSALMDHLMSLTHVPSGKKTVGHVRRTRQLVTR